MSASTQPQTSAVRTVVQKYGGSSVADAEKIRNVARRVAASAAGGNRVVVVVSAMGDTTDDLTSLALQISPVPPARELDMLLTAGERISAALLSMALIEMGHPAVSLTGSQAGIVTDTKHGKARIVDIRASRIEEGLSQGNIVIVAGFQGVSTTFDITTLGRGGSDTTVVALAHSLGAEVCEIYTDVDGVYTADPRIVPNARKLHAVSYEEMLEMAATGAKVLALRAVEYARNYGVVIHCRSSFTDETGTFVKGEDERMEKAVISAVTHDTSEAVVRIKGVPDKPGIAAAVFGAIAEEGINIDMIVQNVSREGHTDVTFTMPKDDLSRSAAVMDKIVADVGAEGYSADAEIAKVSVIGAGMKTNPGVAAAMFQSLAEAGINIEVISTSAIRISCIVRGDDVERAVKVIHDRFELPEAALEREQHPGSPG